MGAMVGRNMELSYSIITTHSSCTLRAHGSFASA
jgi:hypothetical protein